MDEELVLEILKIIRSKITLEEKREALSNYHENDIADVIQYLEECEKEEFYKLLNKDELSEVISYVEDAEEIEDLIEYLDEDKAADILEEMDADDAVDILENLEEEDREAIIAKMDEDAREDINLIMSYEDDRIGSMMTTNFIVISKNDTVQMAMKKLIDQSGENDNITTIFVVDEDEKYYAALDLKDLIRARKNQKLEDLYLLNYPYVKANAIASEVYQDIIDYAEDIIPVVDDNDVLIGALTAHDFIEVIDNEMQEDYQKFAAINGNVDLDSSVFVSMKKRIPWLSLLLVLGFIVSMFLSNFEKIIHSLTTLVFFQTVVLDMAGNAGTQSLAVTIRILTEEDVDKKMIGRIIFKELRVGFMNGLTLGIIAFAASLLYLFLVNLGPTGAGFVIQEGLLTSGIIGISVLCAMTLSSFVGAIIPIFFHSIHVDPAVASGPLITTLNDLLAVSVYYGLAALLLMKFIV